MSTTTSQHPEVLLNASSIATNMLAMPLASSVSIQVKLVRYKLNNAKYFQKECRQLAKHCDDCFNAWDEHYTQLRKRLLDLRVPVDEFIVLLQEIAREVDVLADYSTWDTIWKGSEIKGRLSDLEKKLEEQKERFSFEGENTPLKRLRQTEGWQQSEMGAILDPILKDPRKEANGITLSESERDAILERGFNLVVAMVDAARLHDSALKVAGVALTRAQFNVLFAEVNQAVRDFAVWHGLKVLDVQDLGPALQITRRQVSGTHWTDVHLGSFCAAKVAIKEYRRLPAARAAEAKERITAVLKSWSALKLYDHPNVNPVVGVNDSALQGFSVVTEWADGDTIRMYFEYHREVPDVDLYKLLAEAADGLIHLHEHGVIHGNMKGTNLLVSGDGRALVTDYGLSRILLAVEHKLKLPEWAVQRDSHYCRWRAPEASDYRAPTVASDVWEFGMTVLEVLTGTHPYPEIRSDHGVCMTVCCPGYSGPKRPECEAISDELWEAMQGCWRNKPEERTTMAAIRDALRREEQQRRERPPRIPMEI